MPRSRNDRPSSSANNGFPERRLDDPAQDLSLQGEPEALGEHAADGAEAQRSDADRRDHILERALERRRRPGAPGEQERRPTVEPPRGERERVRRRGVEPLEVVDGDDNDRVALCQSAQDVQEGDPDRMRLGGRTVGVYAQQRRLERAALWRRQSLDVSEVDAVEQVDQARERQLGVGAARPRGKDAQAPAHAAVDPRLPQGRLPSPRATDQHERPDRRIRAEESVELRELGLAADDLRDMLVQLLCPRSLPLAYYKTAVSAPRGMRPYDSGGGDPASRSG